MVKNYQNPDTSKAVIQKRAKDEHYSLFDNVVLFKLPVKRVHETKQGGYVCCSSNLSFIHDGKQRKVGWIFPNATLPRSPSGPAFSKG